MTRFSKSAMESFKTASSGRAFADIQPVEIACVFEELEPEVTRISLRSKNDKVNVSEIASLFGGGGHKAAAGARISGSPLSVQRRVIGAIKKALNKAA